jgi:hypothetical protein
MTDKGRDEYCCCNGCQCKPEPSSLSVSGGTDEQIALSTTWRRFCCSCVPKYACVTIDDGTSINQYDYTLYYPPSSPAQDLDQALYVPANSQTVYAGSSGVIDLNFHFKIDDNKCYFGIASTSLGVAVDDITNAIEIGSSERQSPDYFCKTLSTQGNGYTSFNVDSLTISIAASDHEPIAGRRNCYDESGNIVYDDSPLRNLCCNCSCICDCMFLDYGGTLLILDENGEIVDNQVAIQDVACLSNNENPCTAEWSFPLGVTLSIRPEYDKCILERLIACWKMEELSGTRYDSYKDRDLTEVNSVGQTGGKVGDAADFDPTLSSSLVLYDTEPLERIRFYNNDGSILLWCKLDSTSEDMCILSKYTDDIAESLYELSFDAAQNKFVFTVSNGTQEYSASSSYTGGIYSGTWYQIYVEIDNSEKKLLIKVGDDPSVATSFTGNLQNVSPALYIGRSGKTSPRHLDGAVDQVLVWDRCWNKSSIACCTNIDDYTTRIASIDQAGGQIELNFNASSPNDILTCSQDNRCYAHLDVGELDITTTPAPILLGEILQKTTCPKPVLRWELTHAADEYSSTPYPVVFTIMCKSCSERPMLYLDACCPNGRTNYPNSLIADITTDCENCSSISISLVWSDANQYYSGTAKLCGQDLTIQTLCPFTSASVDWGTCITGGSLSGGSCDPVLISGSIASFGLGCCPSDPMQSVNLNITIHE